MSAYRTTELGTNPKPRVSDDPRDGPGIRVMDERVYLPFHELCLVYQQ